MIITIHGKNIDVTPAIQDAVNNSLNRIEKFKKFISPSTMAKVEIRSYPEKEYKVTVNITLPYKKHLHCEVKSTDLFVAIKNIVRPLSHQLKHLKVDNKTLNSTSESLIEIHEKEVGDYQIDELSSIDEHNDYDKKL